jgi:GTPase SAR1 family protein
MSNSSEHVRVIVLGDSGVGKTTFCRMICAKDMPAEEARKATGSRVLCRRKSHDHVSLSDGPQDGLWGSTFTCAAVHIPQLPPPTPHSASLLLI